ncbi:MAG: PAS domain S-box protein, partial [Maribacter sp.]|nr:PAS domain S-box protein [Maribacter sp.]
MKKESLLKNHGDILVISSDSALKSEISRFLESDEHHINFINEGEIILDKIDQEQPDLILLDTKWNIGESYGLCQKLKTNKFSKNIPIILIGDFKDEDELSACIEKGANDFIATPFKKLELITRVKTQLELFFANRDNQRLVLTEAFHTSAIKVIKEGFVVHDKNDKIVSANEAAADILGLTYNQLLGKDSFDPRWKALHEDGSPFAPEEHPSMISLKKCVSVNDVIMNVHCGEDERKWISINSRPIFGEEGNQTGAVATFLDITERKKSRERLKETLQQLNLAIDTAKLGVWVLNVDSGELNWNDQLLEIYGISRDEFDKNLNGWKKQVHSEDAEYANTRLQEVYGNKSVYNVNFRILKP